MSFTAGRQVQRSALSRIGETYGSLTVLDIVGKDSSGSAICSAKCVCGSEKEYVVNSLVRGSSKSCGCFTSSSKHKSAESHIGENINNMTLLEVVGKNTHGRAIGRFRCGHCGSEHKESLINNWKKNGLKSCGCQKKKTQTKAEDHIGVKYNHLTLIEITGKKGKGHKTGLYHCSNCGKEKDGIHIALVTSGQIKSCGCLLNKAEDAIGTTWGNLKLLKVTQTDNRAKGIHNAKGIFECLLCGNHKELNVVPVKGGIQTDCGCSKHHGFTNHKSFGVYKGMIDRCTNPLRTNYPRYGGRGVTVHPRWLEPNGQGLINFMEDIGDARPSSKYSLHRFWLYNDENRLVEMEEYGPNGTCGWRTSKQQAIEQRSPRLQSKVEQFEKLLLDGYTIEEIAKKMKIKPSRCAFFLSTMKLLDDYDYEKYKKLDS